MMTVIAHKLLDMLVSPCQIASERTSAGKCLFASAAFTDRLQTYRLKNPPFPGLPQKTTNTQIGYDRYGIPTLGNFCRKELDLAVFVNYAPIKLRTFATPDIPLCQTVGPVLQNLLESRLTPLKLPSRIVRA